MPDATGSEPVVKWVLLNFHYAVEPLTVPKQVPHHFFAFRMSLWPKPVPKPVP
jgi:hypothetical protein